MSWKKLSKEKRNNLILVLLLTLTAIVGLGYGLIRFQYAGLTHLTERRSTAEVQLQRMQDTIKHAEQIEKQLAAAIEILHKHEEQMASPSDLTSWFYETIRRFKTSYKVEIPSFSTVLPPSETTLLPDFPYQQATMSINGTGFYEDIGRFLSGFENEFSHVRLQNLDIAPAPAGASGEKEKEKLSFRVDVVALVRPVN